MHWREIQIWMKRIDLKATSRWMRIVHQKDDALNGWNDERAENEGACNKKQNILKKEQKFI